MVERKWLVSMMAVALFLAVACGGCGDDDDASGVEVTLIDPAKGTLKKVKVPLGSEVTGARDFSGVPENTLWMTMPGGYGESVVDRAGLNLYPVTVTSIESRADLAAMGRGDGEVYILTKDLNVGSWTPVEYFNGMLLGRGHRLKNVSIAGQNAGLFSVLEGGVRDLRLDVAINASGSGHVMAGGLAADFRGGMLSNIHVRGAIVATGDSVTVGGIIGRSYSSISKSSADVAIAVSAKETVYAGGIAGGDMAVSRSWSRGSLRAESEKGHVFAGGITALLAGGTVEQCYSTMDVSGDGWKEALVGGITGNSMRLVKESYHALGRIFATSHDSYPFNIFAGGIVGGLETGRIERCVADPGQVYAKPHSTYGQGGITGKATKSEFAEVKVENCLSTFTGGAGKIVDGPGTFDDGEPTTTTALKTQATYKKLDWDFETVWMMDTGGYGYPVFRTETGCPDCDCIVVKTEDDLKNIAKAPDKCYELANDIALGDKWTPIETFTGILKGNGHAITNLSVSGDNAGLFNNLEGEVRDLTLAVKIDASGSGAVVAGGLAAECSGTVVNVAVSGAIAANGDTVWAGGIVGKGTGRLSRSFAAVTVEAKASREAYAGGIAGEASFISRCHAEGDIKAEAAGGEAFVGGMAGRADSVGQSYSTMNLTGSGTSPRVGGIAGINAGGIVWESYYAAGTIRATGTADSFAGGVAGRNKAAILRCAANPAAILAEAPQNRGQGGIAGDNAGSVARCLSAFEGSSAGLGKHSDGDRAGEAELRDETTYRARLGWDFGGVWGMDAGGGYPVLKK